MTVLAMTLLGNNLPEEDAFVSGQQMQPQLRSGTAMNARKFTAADRGTPEYEEWRRSKGAEKKAAWDMMTTANGYRDAGVEIPVAAPAPAPAPAPAAVSQGGGGGDSGGNPFQFIIDLFNPTTTTTTTTPPPNPIEAFFKGLR